MGILSEEQNDQDPWNWHNTDEDGSFAIEGIPVGTYHMVARAFDAVTGEMLPYQKVISTGQVEVVIDKTTEVPELILLIGDYNNDGGINIFDLTSIALQYGQSGGEIGASDLNMDGVVDIYDLVMVSRNLNEVPDWWMGTIKPAPVEVPDAEKSTLTANKMYVKADGQDKITFSVTIVDSNGDPITGLADNRYQSGSDWFVATTSYPTSYLSSEERRPDPDQPSELMFLANELQVLCK